MELTSSYIDSQMEKLAAMLQAHKADDGEYQFDFTQVAAVLDFAIKEIEKAAEWSR